MVRSREKFHPFLAWLFCQALPRSCLARFATFLVGLCMFWPTTNWMRPSMQKAVTLSSHGTKLKSFFLFTCQQSWASQWVIFGIQIRKILLYLWNKVCYVWFSFFLHQFDIYPPICPPNQNLMVSESNLSNHKWNHSLNHQEWQQGPRQHQG